MTCKLMAGNDVLLEQEYYSVGGGFIEWKGYTPPKKGAPKYPVLHDGGVPEARQGQQALLRRRRHGERGRGLGEERGRDQRLPGQDQHGDGQHRQVRTRRSHGDAPGPIKLKTKAGEVYKRAMDDEYAGQKGVGVVAAYALAGSEENARGHLVVTAPTGGSAGVMPALVYVLGEGGRKLPQEKIRKGLLAGAAVGYLCKHNATLSGAEGGCQAEIGVASAMGAALIAQAHDFDPQVVANGAESALEHHLGMTCDPVAGYVQVPCIERCAFGAVKAWTGFMIASNEIPVNRRVDFDTTVSAMALTAKEMNSKYKETSEGGLAVSVTLC
jgi:L-serine dehydratase